MRSGSVDPSKAEQVPRTALAGLNDADWRPDSSAPSGIAVENLRRRGIDRLRLSITPPVAAGLWSKLIGRSAKVSQVITIADQKIRIESLAGGKDETAVVPFSAVRSVSLAEEPRALVLTHARAATTIGAGLPADSLKWLRDRLLLELAGLVWKPVFNVGRRTTRKLSTPDDDTYTRWDPGHSNRLIDSFLEEAPAKSGDLKRALADGDWECARKAVHWLKSSCASVGAAQLSDLCQRMEIEIGINDLGRMRLLGQSFAEEFSRVTGTLEAIRTASSLAEMKQSLSAGTKPEGSGEKPLAGVKVLLAEDSKVNQMLASDYLEDAGCHVTTADNGLRAVEAFRAGAFDVIFMDCQMPEMDGFAATHAIRLIETETLRLRTPIVALTAHALRDDRAHCLASGMSDYMSKPYGRDEIVEMTAKWWKVASGEAGPAVEAAHLVEAGEVPADVAEECGQAHEPAAKRQEAAA